MQPCVAFYTITRDVGAAFRPATLAAVLSFALGNVLAVAVGLADAETLDADDSLDAGAGLAAGRGDELRPFALPIFGFETDVRIPLVGSTVPPLRVAFCCSLAPGA